MTDRATYDFELPPELVAQTPPARRGDSRLLVAERFGDVAGIRSFASLPDLLRSGDLLVVNDSRVLPARLWTRRADTGGRVEILLVRPDAAEPGAWQAMARPARRLRAGQRLEVTDARGEPLDAALSVIGRTDGGEVVVGEADGADLAALAERCGTVPLPPYIRRDAAAPDAAEQARIDRSYYQTVYARPDATGEGSVAAPTAGLHFTPAQLDDLRTRGIATTTLTLHVGPGTFQPPDDEQVRRGRLHPESFHLPATAWRAVADCRARGGRVIAVGTTSLRVLATVERLKEDELTGAGPNETRSLGAGDDPDPEYWGQARAVDGAWDVRGVTRLFLRPPRSVTAADALITNFHLPGSSLLMLVAAFAGQDTWREAYRRAVAARMRFFSYGDAMILLPAGDRAP
jgi:S-adenosylmethionine:tRNA ribosyltransferase-isomerase